MYERNKTSISMSRLVQIPTPKIMLPKMARIPFIGTTIERNLRIKWNHFTPFLREERAWNKNQAPTKIFQTLEIFYATWKRTKERNFVDEVIRWIEVKIISGKKVL